MDKRPIDEDTQRAAGRGGGEPADPGSEQRTARLTVYPAPEGTNSLWARRRWVPLWRATLNFLVVYSCRYSGSLRVKNLLYRAIGIKVGVKVAAGLGVTMDMFFPQLISIGDNSIIGYNTVVLAHEFLIKELRTGPVEIGRDVMIGANVTILPGVRIGDGATVSACSLVNSDVPAGALAGGVPVRILSTGR
jgi:acetyltransferase-like isoleucine patch superfamily enzyme